MSPGDRHERRGAAGEEEPGGASRDDAGDELTLLRARVPRVEGHVGDPVHGHRRGAGRDHRQRHQEEPDRLEPGVAAPPARPRSRAKGKREERVRELHHAGECGRRSCALLQRSMPRDPRDRASRRGEVTHEPAGGIGRRAGPAERGGEERRGPCPAGAVRPWVRRRAPVPGERKQARGIDLREGAAQLGQLRQRRERRARGERVGAHREGDARRSSSRGQVRERGRRCGGWSAGRAPPWRRCWRARHGPRRRRSTTWTTSESGRRCGASHGDGATGPTGPSSRRARRRGTAREGARGARAEAPLRGILGQVDRAGPPPEQLRDARAGAWSRRACGLGTTRSPAGGSPARARSSAAAASASPIRSSREPEDLVEERSRRAPRCARWRDARRACSSPRPPPPCPPRAAPAGVLSRCPPRWRRSRARAATSELDPRGRGPRRRRPARRRSESSRCSVRVHQRREEHARRSRSARAVARLDLGARPDRRRRGRRRARRRRRGARARRRPVPGRPRQPGPHGARARTADRRGGSRGALRQRS